MKKRILLLLLPMLVLAACDQTTGNSSSNSSSQEPSPETEISLEGFSNLLTMDLFEQEVENSNEVTFSEVYNQGDARILTANETLTIYNDETSFATGTEKMTYPATTSGGQETSYEDSYQRIINTKTYGTQKVFYYVTDYADGTLRTTWADSAKRLPVVASGDESLDGVDYLLASSLPAQLTKQVSLLTNQFISTYLLNNPDVQMILPNVAIETNNETTTYSLNDFTYSYTDDDGSTVTVLIEFEVDVTSQGIVQSELHYHTTQVREDDRYEVDDLMTYNISYGTRASSSTNTNLINPEDYFLEEVNEVRAFIYNDSWEKEYVDLNNLPLNEYITFEASDYVPAKAVDLQMYAASSTEPTIIATSGDVFETLATGEATITVESATGVEKTLEVRVNMQPISRIKYNDASSDIETEVEGSTTTRYIYTNTTYDSIYLTVSPTAASLEDIEIEVSDPTILEVSILTTGNGFLELQYVVKENNDTQSVSVTFSSKVDESVSTTITYQIKNRLTPEEMSAYLIGHTYRWDNLYDNSSYSIMTFTDETTGTISYYDGETLLQTTTFTYTFDGVNFNPVMADDALYGYNSGDLKLDGTQIVMRVDETLYVHYYNVVEA